VSQQALTILSIQSVVAYGHVGNSSAVFPLQRLGHEVWPVPTVSFSNHTGYGTWRGRVLDPEDVAGVVTGIEERGVFGQCDAVLSGYLGAAQVGAVVLDAVRRVKAANPAAVFCCDPVMGDVDQGLYVRHGIPEFLRDEAVPQADILTPNQFELGLLTGSTVVTTDDLLAAVGRLRQAGPRTVLVTSVRTRETPTGSIGMVAVSDDGAWAVSTPLLPLAVNGAGDLTAALFLAHTMTASPRVALSRTAASVHAVLEATHRGGHPEIQIVAAQEAIARPDERFEVRALA